MPAYDLIHDNVKNALIKDGWTITDDPYVIVYEGERLYADIAAERSLAAERAGEKIVIEIKSFLGPSLMHDLYEAIGQYMIYASVLMQTAQDRQPYIALRDVIYAKLQERGIFQLFAESQSVSLVIVDIEREEIVQWINRHAIVE